jgi:two-component system OmpR family sensor kinase
MSSICRDPFVSAEPRLEVLGERPPRPCGVRAGNGRGQPGSCGALLVPQRDELVEQLLTLSRLEASVHAGSRERVERTDLVDLVASIAEDAHFEAQASGRSVTFTSKGEAVANVRAELLHRAVENVVRNAVKYTQPGTTVDVVADVDTGDNALVVRVADRGPGVPDSELSSIFERFYRGADGTAGPGFGLGLAITKRAIEAHGGRVTARNRGGGGLVLELTLPLG